MITHNLQGYIAGTGLIAWSVWVKFNASIDKHVYAQKSAGWNYISIPKWISG